MFTVQVLPEAEPQPVQEPKVEVESGSAVSVTAVPPSKAWVQVPEVHESVPGTEVTRPPPLPPSVTVSAYVIRVKVAVTDLAASTVTAQVPVPEHPPPDQPAKVEIASGVAVSITTVPESKDAEQAAPQEIPAGAELTVPPPVPAFATVSVWVNLAVTDFAASTVTAQDPVPEHAPDQPAKVAPESGVAVSVTEVPESNDAAQAVPQEIPAGADDTVPPPVLATVSV